MAPQRSLPTPRKEGMANVIAATNRLLETIPPEKITMRDVARESGHGHRLIVEWFGGKGGLFRAVILGVFEDLAAVGALRGADVPLKPNVRRAFQLFNFMQMHHPEFVAEVRDHSVMNMLEERLVTVFNVPAERARVISGRISLLTMGIAVFRDHFTNLSDDDIISMMQDEFKSTTGVELPPHTEAIVPGQPT